MEAGQRYWAFISYAHEDAEWAEWLHRALEGYHVPPRLRGRDTGAGPAPRRFRPIFRDRTDLAVDPDLKRRIDKIIEDSGFLIVICSPNAARSPWVEDEVVTFKRRHGEDRVLAVIAAGTPHGSEMPRLAHDECFPRALRFHLDPEGEVGTAPAHPVAADLRPAGDGRRRARLKLLAGMLGCDLDELVQRDLARRQGRLGALATASLIAVVVMGILTASAIGGRNEARAQRAQAEKLIEFMLSDLPPKLEPAGRVDLLDAVAGKAMAYYTAQNTGRLDADSLGRRARVLHLMGDLRQRRGDLAAALALFEEAAKSTRELLTRQPDNPQRIYDHAQSLFFIGEVAQSRGQLEDAQVQLEGYQRLARRLVALEPNQSRWLSEVVDADTDVGVVELERHHAEQAAASFASALAILQAGPAAEGRERDHQRDLAQLHAWLADAEFARGNVEAAASHRLTERTMYQAMIAQTPVDVQAIYSLVVNRVKLAAIMLSQRQAHLAERELSIAMAEIGALMAKEPDVVDYREEAAAASVLLSRCLMEENQLDAAVAAAGRAQELAQHLVRKDPTRITWKGDLLGEARVLQMEIGARMAGKFGRDQALAPAIGESARLAALCRLTPHDRMLARVAAEASLLAGDYQARAGRPEQARMSWSLGLNILARAQADGPDPLDRETRALIVQTKSRLAQDQTLAMAGGATAQGKSQHRK